MIRIGIDGHMLGDHSGGNESYYSNMLKNMSLPENVKIYLFVKPDVDISEYKDKFEIVYFKKTNAMLRNFWELSALCIKYKLDVLHTQYFIPFVRPCKVVCTIHDICFEHFKDIFTKKEYYRQKLLIPYAARHSALIFTVSNHAKNDIIEHYGIPNEKIIVTYSAVCEAFRKLKNEELNESELREKFQIGNERYILCVCNLQPRKNLIRLIKAFIEMKKEAGRTEKLVIVGKKAWMFNEIIRTALEGSTDIVFTDYVSKDDLIKLYNAAACFIYPSFFEGFGLPPLESMACGTPVAVARATSLPEVVGEAGIYFNPYDEKEIANSMITLLTDEKIREELIHTGIRQVNIFNWKNSADTIMEMYMKVINR